MISYKLLNKSQVSTVITEVSEYALPNHNPELAVIEETKVNDNGVFRYYYELKSRAHKKYGRPIILPMNYEEELKKSPYNYMYSKSSNILYEWTESFKTNPEEIYKKGKLMFYRADSLEIFDENLKPVPKCIAYNYISTPFSNKYVNLNKELLDFLRSHPWVVNKESLEIQKIPYYNRSSSKDSFVEVHICPDKDTYIKMFESSKKDLKDLISGMNVVYDAEATDYFGIRPYLKR